MSFKSFLGKHAGELSKVANLLGSIVAAIPVNSQTRIGLTETISELETAASNIAKAAKSAKDITVSKADVTAAIKEHAPSIIESLVASAVAAALAKHGIPGHDTKKDAAGSS
jgi:hypothetical protein